MRKKKCAVCHEWFIPDRPFQPACVAHQFEYAMDKIAEARYKKDVQTKKQIQVEQKKADQALKAKKLEVKPRSYWIKRAQAAFNAYIRQRDSDQPCISCQRHHAGQYHAGHYRTVGACPELRFDEDNCHKQCAPCNNHLSGNLVKYRVNLILKVGIKRVEWLEGNHDAKHYSIDDIKQIEKTYKEKLKQLIKT